MSGRKLFLPPFNAIPSQFNGNSYSQLVPTSIKFLDNLAIQSNFTGTPAGNLIVQGSLDYNKNPYPNGVGSFINFQTYPVAAAGNVLITLDGLPFPYMKLLWTPTGTGIQSITTVADVSGSLAGAYFLISTEASVHNYLIWLKVGGVGTAPTVAGYTNEEVDFSTNATAPTIATAIAAVLNSLTGFSSSTATGAVISATNTTAGPFPLATDGAAPLATGFTFGASAGGGTINAFISGKML